MGGCDEPVCRRHALEPRIEVAPAELDDAVTARADEVVMVIVAAPAVAELAGVVSKRVDHTLAREERERPVHGREAESLASPAQARVQLLGRQVVTLARELGEDADALRRRSNPELREQPSSLGRRRRIHAGGILAANENRSRYGRPALAPDRLGRVR